MPWQEQTMMSLKAAFVSEYSGDGSMSRLCRKYGISRKTGYKWLNRFMVQGEAGLNDLRTCRPDRNRTYEQVIWDEIFALREKHSTYGPRKLFNILRMLQPERQWPSISSIKQALKREGFIAPRTGKRKSAWERPPLRKCMSPNDVWCMDFKGWFTTRDGKRCDPLTLLDGFSRYLLTCEPVDKLSYVKVRPVLENAFHEYGKPEVIRTDNGSPFGSTGLRSLSPLSVWLLKQGVWPEKIKPGHPGQNGRVERLHRTLKADALQGERRNLWEYTAKLKEFREQYNTLRPHESLGDEPPAKVYSKSSRVYTPGEELEYSYPDRYRLEKVNSDGYIRVDGQLVYLTESLAKEYIGVGEKEQGRPLLFLGYPLGTLDQHNARPRTP